MTTRTVKQKLFCYVDETGQDDRSEYFIVVTVVSDRGLKTKNPAERDFCSFDYLKLSLEPISAKKGRPSSKLKAF